MRNAPNRFRLFIALSILGLTVAITLATFLRQPAVVQQTQENLAQTKNEKLSSGKTENANPIPKNVSRESTKTPGSLNQPQTTDVLVSKDVGGQREEKEKSRDLNAESTEPKDEEEEFEGNATERLNWFYAQRAYPLDKIPALAREDAYTKRPRAKNDDNSTEFVRRTWQNIGPQPVASDREWLIGKVSGRINAIAVCPNNPNIILIGASTGGIWRSTDAGQNFSPVSDDQVDLPVGDLTFSKSNPNIAYAAMGDPRSSRYGGVLNYLGTGILKSTDAGATWTRTTNVVSASHAIVQIAIHPTDSQIVYVAMDNWVSPTNQQTNDGGIYRTTNGGQTWARVWGGRARSVAINMGDPNYVYAAFNPSSNGGASSGIYFSSDNGSSWALLIASVYGGNTSDIRVATTEADGNFVAAYMGDAGSPSNLTFATSNNNGVSFNTRTLPVSEVDPGQFGYNTYLRVSPFDKTLVFIGSRDVFLSNSSYNFSNLTGAWKYDCNIIQCPGWDYIGIPGVTKAHSDQHAVAFHPTDQYTIYIANDGGIQRGNRDIFQNWNFTSLNQSLSISQFIGYAQHPTDNSISYGGTQDNGTQQRFPNSNEWKEYRAGDGGNVVLVAGNPNNVFSTYIRYTLSFYTRDSNGNMVPVGSENETDCATFQQGTPPNCNNSNVLFYPPVESNKVTQTIYVGTNQLFINTDPSSCWKAPFCWTTSGGDLTGGGVISAIGVQPNGYSTSNHRIYIGGNNGSIQRSIDGGQTWAIDRLVGMPNRFITSITVNPTNPEEAYLTYSGFGTGHIYKRSGTTTIWSWTDISGNLPNIPVNTLIIDPFNPNGLMIGTDIGVYYGELRGSNWIWEEYNAGMPPVVVTKLVVNQNNIVHAATYGRGVYEASLANPSISGEVVNADGSAREGVTVILNPGGRTAVTGGLGIYTFENVSQYTQYTVTPSPTTNVIYEPASRTVDLGINDFYVEDFTANGLPKITGHVQDRNGVALPDVTITVDGTGLSGITNNTGDFSIEVPRNATYTITPGKTDMEFVPKTSLPITVGNTSPPTLPTFTGYNLFTVSGMARDANGVALGDVLITVVGNSETKTVRTNTFNPIGFYQIKLREAANYTFTPALNNYEFNPPGIPINNLPGSLTLNFNARTLLHKLSGVVTDRDTNQPMEDVVITLSGTVSRTTNTNAAGYYEFLDLHESGNYTLTPSFGFWEFDPANKVFNGLSDDTAQNFKGIAPPKIKGKVIDICGDTVSGVEMKAVPSNSTAYTNGVGLFELPVPRGGNYTVTPTLAGWSFAPVSRQVNNVVADVTIDDFIGTPPTYEYEWSGIAANTGPAYDKSWTNPGNWYVAGTTMSNGKYPRCNDYATINLHGGSSVELSSQNNPTGTRTVKRLTLRNGILENGNLTVRERMDWHGSQFFGGFSGTLNTNLTIPPNAELHLQGSANKGLTNGTLKNQGTIIWTGEYFTLDKSGAGVCVIDNENTIRLESIFDSQLFLNGAPDCVVNNKPNAVIRKPTASATNLIFQQNSGFANATLNNEGRFITDAGRLIIYGSADFKTGTRFEGLGITLLTSATKRILGQVTIANGATLETGADAINSGVIIEGSPAGSFSTEGNGVFLVGSLTFFDGTINLNGKTEITNTDANGQPSYVSFDYSGNGIDTINNNGTIDWRGDTISLGSSVFNNYGTFNILCDGIFNSQSSIGNVGSVFTNFPNAVIRKSNTSGTTDFMSYPYLSKFHNNGLVDVQTGTMIIHNGISSGGTFRTAQNTLIEIQQNELYTFLNTNFETNGTFRNNGGFMDGSFRGTLQMLSGGVVNNLTALSPTQTLAAGTFDWRGGFIGVTNQHPDGVHVVIQTGAAMLIDATDIATWSGAFCDTTLTNNGTVQWTGQENTYIGVGGCSTSGLTFNNNGTFFLQSDGTLFRHGDNSTFVFNNNTSGVFKKSDGNGSLKLDVFSHKFNNFGTIEITSGVIEGGGVEFEFKNNSRIKSGGGRFSLNGAGGTSEAQGTVTLEGNGDANNYMLELGGDSNGVALEGNGLTLVSQNNAGFLWTGGMIKGSVLLGANLRTKIQSSGNTLNVTLDGSLSNAGTLDWENGMGWEIGFNESSDSTFTNLSGAIFNYRSTSGFIIGDTFNFINAGMLNIGQTTGTFNFNSGANTANFTNQPTGIINMDIAGASDFDKFTQASLMNLGGSLNVNFTNGFAPNVGDSFMLFDGQMNGNPSRVGAFSSVSLPGINGKSLRLDYNDNDLTLITDEIYIWTGAVDGNWNNPANWQGNVVPPANALVEIPSTGVTNNPDLSSTNITVDNLTIDENQSLNIGDGQTLTVNGVLELEGNVSTFSHRENVSGVGNGIIVIGANGAVSRTGNGYIIGNLKKIFAGAGDFTFHVGTVNGYSPVEAIASSGAGELTVKAVEGTLAPLNPNMTLARYWSLTGSGITVNLTFNYLDSDVAGNENAYAIIKSNSSITNYTHNPPNVVIDTANNRGTIMDVNTFSNWTLGQPFAPTAATASISGRIITATGSRLPKDALIMIEGSGLSQPVTVKATASGYFNFDNIPAGSDYIISVRAKGYTFTPNYHFISLIQTTGNIDFIARPERR